jgi:hypothetical protein
MSQESPSWSPDDEVTRDELETALRFVHLLLMRITHKADRVEGLLRAVTTALIDAGELDRDQLARVLEPDPEKSPIR